MRKGSLAAWTLAACALGLAQVAAGAEVPRGAIAGKVFHGSSQDVLGGIAIDVRALDGEASFEVTTDDGGGFYLEDAPAGVYQFTLSSRGISYPVDARLDVRVQMPFLLESCFELDTEAGTASVREECNSGFVEEARVATIGPHRFLVPENSDILQEQESQEAPTEIAHEELQCLTHEHFPQVDAGIAPGGAVQSSRVYFRSDKYPDFYYVEMANENPTIDDFRAVLPKPSPETEIIYYYLESVDSNFDSLQTPEYDPPVLEVDECERRGAPVWFTGEDPGIVVGATAAGLAAIPPGFQAVGITGFINSLGVLTTVGGATAAGGAASTTGLVLVVGGGAAAATGAAVVATGGSEASPP